MSGFVRCVRFCPLPLSLACEGAGISRGVADGRLHFYFDGVSKGFDRVELVEFDRPRATPSPTRRAALVAAVARCTRREHLTSAWPLSRSACFLMWRWLMLRG